MNHRLPITLYLPTSTINYNTYKSMYDKNTNNLSALKGNEIFIL